MGEIGAAYEGCRRRMTELVEGLDDDGAAQRVPACPDWTVHDLLAHVTGVVDDALAGRLEGAGSDKWTAVQVEARRGRPLAEVVAEWAAAAPAFEAVLDDLGMSGRQAVFDCVLHEHDLRGALGRPGGRDSDAVAIGLTFAGPAITGAAKAQGIDLRVEADGAGAWGAEEADAVLRGAPFEVLRATTGRRSAEQVRAMDWQGDVESALPAFTYGPFRPCHDPVVE
ncbi:MAG TPA: maleylpyruvate isomerase family mycothiol-dependent enzyme [Acidimicrobiales bacterium]|nr:maleylpyruvate isomerase family mycothiol-dependent enzyme [Acidimicrobiales bacterium]